MNRITKIIYIVISLFELPVNIVAEQQGMSKVKITINLLGGLALYHQGNKIPLPKSKRKRALLAYIILTKRPHRRDRLCELFWESPEDIKGALRWSLSNIHL